MTNDSELLWHGMTCDGKPCGHPDLCPHVYQPCSNRPTVRAYVLVRAPFQGTILHPNQIPGSVYHLCPSCLKTTQDYRTRRGIPGFDVIEPIILN